MVSPIHADGLRITAAWPWPLERTRRRHERRHPELVDGERVTPPCFHEAYTWIEEDWDRFGWDLPKVRP